MQFLDEAARILASAKRIAVFTGAGISAESGIDTFRDSSGLWQRFPPERFATFEGLVGTMAAQPWMFAQFLHAVLAPIGRAKPNPGHLALATLERFSDVTIITQNIDALHQDAGSSKVLEVHGTLFDVVTVRKEPVRSLSRAQLREMAAALEAIPKNLLALPRIAWSVRKLVGIGRGLAWRPDVVLFGEAMKEPAWSRAREAAASCDAMIVVGTSGTVAPASMLPTLARARGARVVGVDPRPGNFDVWLEGTAAEVLPRLVENITRSRS